MSQQFPTSAATIYDILSTDSVFVGLLGKYRFKGNTGPSTALSVVSPGQSLPSLRKVTGIECIVQDVGNSVAQDYLTGAPDIITTWSLFLVAWEPSTGGDLQEAVDHILKRFVGSQAVQTVAVSDGLGALVQTKVFIMSNKPVRLL